MARSEIPFIAQSAAGDGAIVQVTITVRGGGSAILYAAEVGSATQSNPTFSDSTGRIKGWLEEGSYTLTFGAPLSFTRALDITRGDGVSRIANGAVTAAAVASNAVTTAAIANATLQSIKLVANSVTEPKVAANAVDSRVYAPAGIATANILNLAASTRTLLDGSITNAELGAGAVGTANLVDSSITTAKLATDAVTTTKLTDKSVTADKLADAAITGTKLGSQVVGIAALDDVMPIGMILPYLGTSLPSSDWAFCDGSTVSSTTYPALWALIGATYGGVASAFQLPDLRGRFPFGYAPGGRSEVNAMGDRDSIALANRFPQHGHSLGTLGISSGGHEHTNQHFIDITKGAYTFDSGGYPTAYGRRFFDNGTYTTSSVGHSHGLGGSAGDTSGASDTSAYFTVNFIMRVK